VRAERRQAALAIGLSWFSYASYYLGRKGFSVAKASVARELGLAPAALALIDSAYLGAYALGQVPSGLAADRWGSRRVVGAGLFVSAAACALFGASSGLIALCAWFALNGLAQSTGWPGTTKIVAQWSGSAARGRVMGAWSTCYQVGGIAATALASGLLGAYGWRAAFYGPALWLVASALLVVALLPRAPAVPAADGGRDHRGASRIASSGAEVHDGSRDERGNAPRGLDVRDDGGAAAPSPAKESAGHPSAGVRALGNASLYAYGASYFCIKLIRYSLLFWLPFYLHTAGGFDEQQSGYLSTAFEIGGVAGSIGIGDLSDRSRRARGFVAMLSLLALALACALYAALGLREAWAHVAMLAVIGALLFGPDALLSGAAAQEAAGPQSAATAAGLVNGLGSAGALLQGALTVGVQSVAGWDGVFYCFVALALAAAACLGPSLRAAR
jgi:sugar phosphate permease